MDKLVSIIVPVYNAGTYIENTIEMVCRQTYAQWELLLVDDCSADDGRKKIEAFCRRDERIRLIAKDKNEGAAKARNTGILSAKGRFIAFLDADDVWLPAKLEKELQFMEEKEAAFVFTGYEFGNEQAEGTGKVVTVPEALTYKQALPRTVIFTSTVLFDTEKIDKSLIEMPDVKSEDTATWWKILRNGYTAYGLNEVLVIYRRPGKSLSSNKLVAIKRIWNLYRREEKLSLPYSIYNFVLWAFGAVLRRI
ncbi:glycosyltransferase family 2 protein [Kineothrix sedimenti]|uniref:Glycosyltransferase family 2 protein n=1 Tax=Kineothrix sedimenti TaxID=3123317 RepID=A0ABZ3ETM1_9FIRM